jgi:hypothetical protein
MTRLELVARLTAEGGQPIVVTAMWREAFAALDDPTKSELIVSTPRQEGKSQLAAAMMASSLFTQPGSYSALIAAGQAQAESVFHRKVRRPVERLLRELGVDKRHVIITKRSIELLETGSKCEVLASDEGTAVGRSIGEGGVLVFDECRDIPDAIFAALLPSVASGGKVVLIGTAGAPRGFFYEAIRHPSPESWVYWSHENSNPYASRPVVDFLTRRLGLLLPNAKRRELDNEFTEDGDSLLPAALIDAAIDDTLGELPGSDEAAFAGNDLSRRSDLTSRVVLVRTAPRRPEARDHLVVASIRVWDPKQSSTGETDFADVRADLAALPDRFPRLEAVLVDEGAEAGSVLPFAKATASLTQRVRGFVATAESNMLIWSALAARLHARTISLPRHERLLAELRGLRQEAFAFGSRWRVVDSSRKFHRDVAVSLALAVHAAGEPGVTAVDIGAEPIPSQETTGGFHGRTPHALLERQAARQTFDRPVRGRFWH